MHVSKIEEHLYLIDVETGGIENFVASYVLKGKQTVIIETGPTSSIPNLLSALKELNVKPEQVAYVAVSHIHLDHGGGAGALLRHLPKAKVVVHPRGAPHLVNPEKLWQQSRQVLGNITEIYGPPEPVPEERIIAANDGMILDVGNDVKLKVIETLGHASHHLSYYEPLTEGIFPGDAAGIYLNKIGVIVPTTPSPFRLDIALASLDKLINLKPKVLYYSHFGKAENAMEKLQTYVNQLKLWARIAKQGLENGEDLADISKRILESDEAIRKARDYIQSHAVLSETVLGESVQGVVDFVEKFKQIP
ncbi:MAG: MBL fold metallo-hydrolase [Candidatus Bathyarchaeota archaeon]|jgi:glyoxylase-like metal-dependent hydrolase (beta-lactamase superfamily II)|nr:MBL fold metallo-hydrolase [Candidatus Bathyarchaeota archaeon A05DMB-5]MDH7558250.1 MBL fold metallo-hydrolase [Candidatus Bathyarchaeota archaeon]